MKKYFLYLTFFTSMLFGAVSCEDENDVDLQGWRVANQQAFNAITNNSQYKELKSPGNEGSIYYRVIEKGEGKDSIYYTSMVKCHYIGRYAADYTEYNIKKGDIFDQLLHDDGNPFHFNVGTEVIKGWKTALYNMVKGDKWEVYIPYQLGYGIKGSKNIPGYSTLVFEMEVVDVTGVDDI